MRRLRRTTWAVAGWTLLCGVVTLLWIWFGMLVLFIVWLVTRAPRSAPVAANAAPGDSTPRFCASCGSAVTMGAVYCLACGKRVAPEDRGATRHAVMVGSPFSRQ